ncbi:MAG: recombinase family protein [Polyangiaceae bacterium]|nr:recombinase family protein [Polyangiaceae bacterium]
MKAALIYARAESRKLIPDQIDRLQAFASKNGYTIIGTHADVARGRSAFTELLVRAVHSGEEVTVLVTNPSRIMRDAEMLALMMFILERSGVQLRFLGLPEAA